MEIPFYGEPTCMPSRGVSPVVGYVANCLFLGHQDCRDGYHYSREGTGRPCITLRKNKLGLVLLPSDITNTGPENWPVAHAIHNTGHRYAFSVNQTTKAAGQTAEKTPPSEP